MIRGLPRTPRLILASRSPRRLALLEQAGVVVDGVVAPDIEEGSDLSGEKPGDLAQRLAAAKGVSILEAQPRGTVVLAADTVVARGRRVYPKPLGVDEARRTLQALSGGAHRVRTALWVGKAGEGRPRSAIVMTRVVFKRFSTEEMELLLDSGQWRDAAGGYAIQGAASSMVVRLVGSYTNVVGLPLRETVGLLESFGVRRRWPGKRDRQADAVS